MVTIPPKSDDAVVARATGEGSLQVRIEAGSHSFLMDEPLHVGGRDTGPNPFDLLSAAIAGCTLMTLRLYAHRKGWALDGLSVRVTHRKESAGAKDRFERVLDLGIVTDDQRQSLLSIAERCPVHLLIERGAEVRTLIAAPDLVVTDHG